MGFDAMVQAITLFGIVVSGSLDLYVTYHAFYV